MHDNQVLISLATREKLLKEPYGRNVLSIFYKQYPTIAPQSVKFYEFGKGSLSKPISTIDDALKYWERDSTLYRHRSSVKGRGLFYSSAFCLDGSKVECIDFQCNWKAKIDWFNLFRNLVCSTKSFFGHIHVFTESENETKDIAVGTAVAHFLNGAGSYLNKGIPQLGWGHYFGEEYLKELNLPLLKDHGFKIEPLGEGYVFKLTDHLSDVIDDYDAFNERRKLLKSLFRPGLFQNYAKYEHLS